MHNLVDHCCISIRAIKAHESGGKVDDICRDYSISSGTFSRMVGANDKNSSPSFRVRLATEQSVHSPQSSL